MTYHCNVDMTYNRLVCIATAAATANNVRLVVANDPDADRLAAAEQVMNPDGSGSGNFVSFSGKIVW
jgi:phosphomannomutase